VYVLCFSCEGINSDIFQLTELSIGISGKGLWLGRMKLDQGLSSEVFSRFHLWLTAMTKTLFYFSHCNLLAAGHQVLIAIA